MARRNDDGAGARVSRKTKLDPSDFQHDLWEASCQVKALGEIVMFYRREPALDEDEVWYGYGSLLKAVGERLARWAKHVDEAAANQSARKPPRKNGKK